MNLYGIEVLKMIVILVLVDNKLATAGIVSYTIIILRWTLKMSSKIHTETSQVIQKTIMTDRTPPPLGTRHGSHCIWVGCEKAVLPKNFMKPKVEREEFTKSRVQLRFNDSVAGFLALMTIMFGYIEYEVYYDNNYESTVGTDFLRSLNVILSLIIIFLVIRHYIIVLRFLKHQEMIHPSTYLW